MSDTENFRKIESVISEVLGREITGLNPETKADSIEGWDSLTHIQIVVGLEQLFAIRFSAAELIDYQNIGALADGIERKLAKDDS